MARTELKDTGYEIFIGALSTLSIVNMVLINLVAVPALDQVLLVINVVISIILFLDFCYRLYSAPSRRGYFISGYGWADLLASLPLTNLKILRLFRLIRVVRLLRQLGVRTVVTSLVHNRAGSALLSLLLVAILVMEFGSLTILGIESQSPDANIQTSSDAMWYLLVSMSTVGYGDRYPVTENGRILGAMVIVMGVGIFGTLTGFLANAFVPRQHEDSEEPEAEPSSPDAPREPQQAPSPPAAEQADDSGPDPEAGRRAALEALREQHRVALATIEELLDSPGRR